MQRPIWPNLDLNGIAVLPLLLRVPPPLPPQRVLLLLLLSPSKHQKLAVVERIGGIIVVAISVAVETSKMGNGEIEKASEEGEREEAVNGHKRKEEEELHLLTPSLPLPRGEEE